MNNAAVINLRRATTVDGIEASLAVNHLAYFLLTNLLLERIRATPGARIVNVASEAHRAGTIDFEDLGFERGYRVDRVYGRAKLANILFTAELARRLEGSGATANCAHPGGVSTGLASNNAPAWLHRAVMFLLRPVLRSPEQGADTIVFLATAPEVAGVSGRYFANRREKTPSREAQDPEIARRLWEVSTHLCGMDA